MLRRQDNITPNSRIGAKNVHLSSLIDFCARQYFLAGDDIVPGDKPTGSHRVMWELGYAAERHVVNSVITDRRRFGVVGRWRCLCKTTSYQGVYNPSQARCPQCTTEVTNYKQPIFVHEAIDVTGSPDLSFFVQGLLLIVEVKSMNKDDFDKLEAPLPDHKFQALGYRRIAKAVSYPVHDMVHVVYVKKDFKWGDPYKEYAIEEDMPTSKILNRAWSDATSLKKARETKTAPPKLRQCASPTSPKAKKCPMVARCFNWRD